MTAIQELINRERRLRAAGISFTTAEEYLDAAQDELDNLKADLAEARQGRDKLREHVAFLEKLGDAREARFAEARDGLMFAAALQTALDHTETEGLFLRDEYDTDHPVCTRAEAEGMLHRLQAEVALEAPEDV